SSDVCSSDLGKKALGDRLPNRAPLSLQRPAIPTLTRPPIRQNWPPRRLEHKSPHSRAHRRLSKPMSPLCRLAASTLHWPHRLLYWPSSPSPSVWARSSY